MSAMPGAAPPEQLKRLRAQLFAATWLSYAGFYVTRKVFSVVKGPLRDTLGGLNEYTNSPAPKSANAKRNALHLARKLRLHMARVRDLINAHKLAAAVVATMQAAGSVSLAPCAKLPGC